MKLLVETTLERAFGVYSSITLKTLRKRFYERGLNDIENTQLEVMKIQVVNIYVYHLRGRKASSLVFSFSL